MIDELWDWYWNKASLKFSVVCLIIVLVAIYFLGNALFNQIPKNEIEPYYSNKLIIGK